MGELGSENCLSMRIGLGFKTDNPEDGFAIVDDVIDGTPVQEILDVIDTCVLPSGTKGRDVKRLRSSM